MGTLASSCIDESGMFKELMLKVSLYTLFCYVDSEVRK